MDEPPHVSSRVPQQHPYSTSSAPVPKKENSGGFVSYYLCQVDFPQREEQPPYQAECEDLIEALGLGFDEANIFKEMWRTAVERKFGIGKEGNNPLRAAQKYVHYSNRCLRRAKREYNQEKTNG